MNKDATSLRKYNEQITTKQEREKRALSLK